MGRNADRLQDEGVAPDGGMTAWPNGVGAEQAEPLSSARGAERRRGTCGECKRAGCAARFGVRAPRPAGRGLLSQSLAHENSDDPPHTAMTRATADGSGVARYQPSDARLFRSRQLGSIADAGARR